MLGEILFMNSCYEESLRNLDRACLLSNIAEVKIPKLNYYRTRCQELLKTKVHKKNDYSIDQFVPEIFSVETILGCDLKCPECAIGGDFVSRKKGLMKNSQFKVIVDKNRPYCKYLYLQGATQKSWR